MRVIGHDDKQLYTLVRNATHQESLFGHCRCHPRAGLPGVDFAPLSIEANSLILRRRGPVPWRERLGFLMPWPVTPWQ
jgi:hypothetical protein